ncbi:unnamed protein product [Mortierella alpina]
MTDKNNSNTNQSAAAALQLNTSLVRTLADTRRDSAVAIASADVELLTPANRNTRPLTMPAQTPEDPGLGQPKRVGTQHPSGQDTSVDTATTTTTTTTSASTTTTALNASEKEPKKTKKKKKKASKSPSSGLSTDQPASAQQAASPTVEKTSQSLSSTAAAATHAKRDHSDMAMVHHDLGTHQTLTEESLEWLESAVVRGDTKPTGKRQKAKKKSKKTTRDGPTSTSTPSSVKGEALSENDEEDQQREQDADEAGQTIFHERTSAENIPTLTTSHSGGSSPSQDGSTALTPKDDLAFLEDDFLGKGGSGSWADDVDEYVGQTAGGTATAPSTGYTPPVVHTPQGSASTYAILPSKQPSQDMRRSETAAEERVDRTPWSHSKKNYPQQPPQHSSAPPHAYPQNASTGRHGTQEQYQPHPSRHQEHNKQQRVTQPRPSLARHQSSPHASKSHADHPPSHQQQSGARSERSSSYTKSAGPNSNRPFKQTDPSSLPRQPQALRPPPPPEVEWDDREKIIQLLTSRWNAALASVGTEGTDSAVYYSSS